MALIDALRIVSVTDPGKARGHNEDSVATCPERGIVVLADGMGGHNAGEVASGIASAAIVAGLAQCSTPDATQDPEAARTLAEAQVREQISNANAEIFAKAQSDHQCQGMGTTVVACLFYRDMVTVGHVGDSRLYRWRDGGLQQITRDHSVLQEQISAGLIRAEDAHLSRNKNLVTRAVGIGLDVNVEVHSFEVRAQDIYLLCSDGLSDMIGDQDIEMTLDMLKANLDLCAAQLVEAANDAGGRDNISVILVQIVQSFAMEAALADGPQSVVNENIS